MHIQKKMKVLGSIFAVFLLVAFAILLSLPTVLSTKAGKNQVVRLINSQIPGSFSAESVSLSWIGSQIFKGVTLKSLEGDTIFTFDSFRTETPLIKFLFSGPGIGKTELKNFNINIVEEYPEVTNLQQALGNKKIKFKRKKDDVIIRLPLAEIALKSKKPRQFHKPEPIVFNHVDILIDSATFEKPIIFRAKGETKQGDLLGHFTIDTQFLSGMAKKWQFNRKANVAVKANVENFPVDMLDIALTLDQPELHGIMRDLMGDRITISVDQSLSEQDGLLQIKTESPTTNINLVASMEEGKYILHNAGEISFLITPEFFDRIASRGRTTSLLRLAKPTRTVLTIDDLSIPIDFEDRYPNALNIGALSMHAKLDSQEINFTGSPFWGEVSIREINSTIEANAGSQNAVWRLRGEANQNGQHIPIKLDATIYKPKFGENFFESLKNQTNIHIQLAGVPLCLLDHPFFSEGSLLPASEFNTTTPAAAPSPKDDYTHVQFSAILNADPFFYVPLEDLEFEVTTSVVALLPDQQNTSDQFITESRLESSSESSSESSPLAETFSQTDSKVQIHSNQKRKKEGDADEFETKPASKRPKLGLNRPDVVEFIKEIDRSWGPHEKRDLKGIKEAVYRKFTLDITTDQINHILRYYSTRDNIELNESQNRFIETNIKDIIDLHNKINIEIFIKKFNAECNSTFDITLMITALESFARNHFQNRKQISQKKWTDQEIDVIKANISRQPRLLAAVLNLFFENQRTLMAVIMQIRNFNQGKRIRS